MALKYWKILRLENWVMGKRCIGKLENIKIGKLVDELGVAQKIPNLRPQSGPCMLEEHPDKSTQLDHFVRVRVPRT